MEKLAEKFKEKYIDDLDGGPGQLGNIWYKEVVLKNKKTLSLSKLKKKEKTILDTLLHFVNKDFRKLFFEGEAIKSIKTNILGPLLMKDMKDMGFAITYMKDNKVQLKNCLPYAIYCHGKKSFHWLPQDKNIKDLCKDFFKDLPFCKYDGLKHVSLSEADSIALWYRTMWYALDRYFITLKNWKTFNLIMFEIKNKDYHLTIYTLSDFGIKNPKYTEKISGKIGLIRTLPTILNKEIKGGSTKRTRHRIKKSDIKKLVK